MGKIKLYTDEHVPPAVPKGLRQRGVDALTAQEADMLGAEDAEHLRWATAQSRVIFSQDQDFLRLHAAGVSHSGIVYAPQQTSIGAMMRGLMLIYDVLDSEEMVNHVEFI